MAWFSFRDHFQDFYLFPRLRAEMSRSSMLVMCRMGQRTHFWAKESSCKSIPTMKSFARPPGICRRSASVLKNGSGPHLLRSELFRKQKIDAAINKYHTDQKYAR